MSNKLTAIDLFCGCGGFSKGITDSGIDIIAGIDIWDKCIDNYNKNFEHQGICADLCTLSPEKFNEQYNKENKGIDIIVGSPPCQGMSISGKRDLDDPRNNLFKEYVNYLNYFKPKAFLLENVIGMLSMKNSKGELIIDNMMKLLEKDYNCIITKLYASDFEVPQNRRRVIIIGFDKKINIIPEEPNKITQNIEDRPSVSTILEKDTNIPQNSKLFLSQKAIDGINRKKNKSKAEGKGFGAQYLKLDKPSYTIPARYWKDGYDALVYYNEKKIRRLSIKELKRIQSFPDNFILEGSKKDVIMQIGNAVACRFAYHLGNYLIKSLSQNL